jgi:segregation and condensation protein A
MNAVFAVKVRDFEGPLELLLNLVEERKMLISDVSLSTVADDFLKYLQSQNGFPLGQAAHFILVSATLLLLKSRSLLPVLSLTKDEEGDIKDLEFRLKLYQVFRNATRSFANGTRRIFFGDGARIVDPMFVPPPDLSLSSIQAAGARAIETAPRVEKKKEISVQAVISLEEMMDRLSDRIQKGIQLSFRDFAGSVKDKREMVVSFLAMLELVKRGMVLVEQDGQFTEISMKYSGALSAPSYD